MSASEAARFAGQYRDGLKAAVHAVEAELDQGQLRLRGTDLDLSMPMADVQVSDRLGRLPRTLTLPGGASLVIEDSDALAAALGEQRNALHRMESKAGFALAAVAALCGALALLYFVGIPKAADALAEHLGPELELKFAGSSLKGLDASGPFTPSTLDAARQDRLRAHLLPSLQAAGLPPERLNFRNAGKDIGANAFALLGSDIVLTDALVELLSPDEINAVVAHELGHVHHRHVARMLIRGMGVSGMTMLLLGNGSLGGDLAQGLGLANYSREFESEADAHAERLLKASGGSPCDLASALKKLEQHAGGHTEGAAQWLSSHPRSEDRIAEMARNCKAPSQ